MSESDLGHSIKEGFGSIHRRIDDFISTSQHRHSEVIAKIASVSSDVEQIAGRVTRVETRVDLIAKGPSSDDGASVSVADLKWYLAIAGGAVTGTLAVLRMAGKL